MCEAMQICALVCPAKWRSMRAGSGTEYLHCCLHHGAYPAGQDGTARSDVPCLWNLLSHALPCCMPYHLHLACLSSEHLLEHCARSARCRSSRLVQSIPKWPIKINIIPGHGLECGIIEKARHHSNEEQPKEDIGHNQECEPEVSTPEVATPPAGNTARRSRGRLVRFLLQQGARIHGGYLALQQPPAVSVQARR